MKRQSENIAEDFIVATLAVTIQCLEKKVPVFKQIMNQVRWQRMSKMERSVNQMLAK